MSSVSVPHRQLEASASFHLLSAGSYSNIASEDLLNFVPADSQKNVKGQFIVTRVQVHLESTNYGVIH